MKISMLILLEVHEKKQINVKQETVKTSVLTRYIIVYASMIFKWFKLSCAF